MSDRKSEIIYDAVTNISDEHVEEALVTKLVKKRFSYKMLRRFAAAAAACAIVVVGVFAAFSPKDKSNFDSLIENGTVDSADTDMSADSDTAIDDGADDRFEESINGFADEDSQYAFMSYAGCILPMTLVGRDAEITASRDVTFDFSAYSGDNEGEAIVTDDYTLTNTSNYDKKITVLYPFISSLKEVSNYMPVLTLNGRELKAEINVGDCTNAYSWEEYNRLLSDGRYMEKALSDSADLSEISAFVYELSGDWAKALGDAADIHAVFSFDWENSIVLSHGFYSIAQYDDYMDNSVSLSELSQKKDNKCAYLLVIGDDIENPRMEGDESGKYDLEIKRMKTNLADALKMVLPAVYSSYDYGDAVDFDLFYRVFSNYLVTDGVLAENSEERYDSGLLTDIKAPVMEYVFYLESEITIPAGKSVTVSAEMVKARSFDYGGMETEHQGLDGYDLATQCGSELVFTEQTVRLIEYDLIEMTDQNFGFDLAGGVSTVKLDPTEEHYYMEIK